MTKLDLTNFKRPYQWLIHRWVWFAAVMVLGFVSFWGPTMYANLSTKNTRYDLARTDTKEIPKKDVAIVFGALVYKSGRLSPYLEWRVQTAVKLYDAHRVKKLLMTGDNSTSHYNEPVAMQRYAMKLGVPKDDIVLDYAGFSTYESCYRAHAIFSVNSAVLITQGYHLPRALVTCNSFDLQAIGVNATSTAQGNAIEAREWLATDKMVLELALKPKPTFLGMSEPL